ncbi:AAA family ATPase [Streptomyces sp. NPDC014006]|uniref:AAA family ATPase n=1 Tax=Streptomyces sp. NPDC014006 TaxID=3364870 RepID=UPI0036FE842A
MQHMGGDVRAEIALAGADVEDLDQQRTLLTVAVRDYDDVDEDEAEEFAEGIDEQLEVVAQWWGDGGLLPEFRQVPPRELTSRDHIEALLRDEGVREMRGLALVLFITGHGIAGPSGSHFLKLPQSVQRRQLATAVRTSDIIAAALDSHVKNVLVIVNACYAGKLDRELTDLVKDIGPERWQQCQLDVLVTCDHNQTVQVRRFPTVLRSVYDRLRTSAGITTEYLSVAEFMAEYERALRAGDRKLHRLRRLVDGSGYEAPSPCLPNPGYRHAKDLLGAGERQATTTEHYWLDRATGRTHESDDGWYFRGRKALNRKVAEFLSPHHKRGVLLITGSAGSGKSAVVARAVVLSDSRFRADPLFKAAVELTDAEAIPPEGAVNAAVLAHRRNAAQVAGDLLRELGVQPEKVGPAEDQVVRWKGQLLDFVRAAGRPITLVIDGLDEASERQRIVHDVLGPLSPFCQPAAAVPGQRQEDDPAVTEPAVRLLIGIRSTRPPVVSEGLVADDDHGLLNELRQVFRTAAVERTDGEETAADIEEYLYALICAGGHQESARTIAADVAPVLTPSFIDARLAGEQLRQADDPATLAVDAQWQQKLRQGIRGLLIQDLRLVEQDEDGIPRDAALSLLRAAAFAQGAGVPWSDIWPQMAGVFLRRKLGRDEWDALIKKLLAGRLSGYLAHDHEDNRVVYRPAHEALTDVLMNTDDDLTGDEQPDSGSET